MADRENVIDHAFEGCPQELTNCADSCHGNNSLCGRPRSAHAQPAAPEAGKSRDTRNAWALKTASGALVIDNGFVTTTWDEDTARLLEKAWGAVRVRVLVTIEEV